jgi:hypothetical protein
MLQCPFYPVPHTAALTLRKPPSAGHATRATLLRAAVKDFVFPFDRCNTSWLVVGRLRLLHYSEMPGSLVGQLTVALLVKFPKFNYNLPRFVQFDNM